MIEITKYSPIQRGKVLNPYTNKMIFIYDKHGKFTPNVKKKIKY